MLLKISAILLNLGLASCLLWLSAPHDADRVSRALAFESLHDLKRADIELLQVQDPDSFSRKVRFKIAKIYYKGLDYSQAEPIFADLLETDPSRAATRYYLARIYLKQKKYEKVEEMLKPLLGDSSRSWVYEILGDLNRNKKEKKAALEFYEKAHQMKPAEPRLLLKLGELNVKMYRLADARKNFEEGLVLSPKDEKFSLNLVTVLQRQEDDAAYFERIWESYKKDPIFNYTYIRIGELYRKYGYYQAAIDHYKDFLQRYPRAAWGYFNLGLVYLDSDQFEEARRQFNKALDYAPSLIAAHYYSGLASIKLNELDLAYESIKRAYDKGYPDLPEGLLDKLKKALHIYE